MMVIRERRFHAVDCVATVPRQFSFQFYVSKA